ncbi:hypothetical protein N1F91_20715 [Aquibium sp. ELW1220]|nr:hypothetical protein [Aquibium sp. ELW1220]MDN2582411.1 hypothetical protein [Aquibium sp. ELW1220]
MAAVAPDGSQVRVNVDLRSLPSEFLRSLRHRVEDGEAPFDGRGVGRRLPRQVTFEGIDDDLSARPAGPGSGTVDPRQKVIVQFDL